ncbi:VapE domain-containing protein [Burkholderia ubonensis]|uniref:VapE domain-containing protein n=1 Tax=Burkholderia ubonensis TaxID=101571 RepID=UPI0009B3DD14|nr:VapE domain-containing protein [Burkholderia ubonensis]
MPNSNVDGNSEIKKYVRDQQPTTPTVGSGATLSWAQTRKLNPNAELMEWGTESESDEALNANKAVEESRARQKQAEAEREARMAAIREETTSGTNIFESQSDGEELQKAKKAVAESRARRAAAAAEEEEMAAKVRKDPDIVKRAAGMAMHIQFKDFKKVRQGDIYIQQPLMTDENKKVVLDALFKDEKEAPHHDLFRGRVVDHRDELIDDHYSVSRWIEAFSAAGLKGVSWRAAREALREWALGERRNDLILRLQGSIPNWDRKERIRSHLIEFFECRDTDLNRDFSEYFWLSLYCRVMMPGSLAPMVLSIFGAQGCGKSLFQKRLAQIITGKLDADAIQLNLDGDRLDFLRNITGNSVIASVGEMTGFTRGDLNKIKDFITRQNDQLHYKFEGTFTQMRQWITILDGNKYEGLQRDDSGNRRFYPVFCGQIEDEANKPRWREDFKVSEEKWKAFEGEVWQMLAEAQNWILKKGVSAYEQIVRRVEKQVKEFSDDQMNKESGTVSDDIVVPYIDAALREVDLTLVKAKDGAEYVAVRKSDIESKLNEIARRRVTDEPRFDMSLTRAMKARGSSERLPMSVKIGGKKTTVSAYKFVKFKTTAAFYEALDKRLGIENEDDWIEGEVKSPM